MSTDFSLVQKTPVLCTPSQGGVHALLITASLWKIVSGREHAVELNHPPVSKQMKLGGSYMAALAISRHGHECPWFGLGAVLSTAAASH